MKQTTLKELYIEELEDLLSAENQLVRALPKIIEAVMTKELGAAIEAHLEQTHVHVDRLNEVFKLLGEPAKQKTCEAMKGLLKEGDSAIADIEKGPVRDAAIIGACRRVEHYEMAAYCSTRAIAETLGFQDQADILGLTRQEESEANEVLSRIATKTVNSLALLADMVGSST